jgi:hypothetical protein
VAAVFPGKTRISIFLRFKYDDVLIWFVGWQPSGGINVWKIRFVDINCTMLHKNNIWFVNFKQTIFLLGFFVGQFRILNNSSKFTRHNSYFCIKCAKWLFFVGAWEWVFGRDRQVLRQQNDHLSHEIQTLFFLKPHFKIFDFFYFCKIFLGC